VWLFLLVVGGFSGLCMLSCGGGECGLRCVVEVRCVMLGCILL